MGLLTNALLIFMLYRSTTAGNSPVTNTTMPTYVFSHVGARVRLECPLFGKLIDIRWEKDGVVVNGIYNQRYREETDPPYALHYSNGSLLIDEAHITDTGRFLCTAIGGFGQKSVNLTLIVCRNANCSDATEIQRLRGLSETTPTEWSQLKRNGIASIGRRVVAPLFVNMSHEVEQSVIVGDRSQLTCNAEGWPRPRLRWYVDGENRRRHHRAREHNPPTTVHRSKSHRVQTHIPGIYRYTCVASSPAGNKSFNYTIKVVHQDPNLEMLGSRDREVHVTSGNNVNLTCRIKSRTTPKVKWYKRIEKDSQRQAKDITLQYFETDSEAHFRHLDTWRVLRKEEHVTDHILRLPRVETNAAGFYYCVATKNSGFEYQRVHLLIQEENPSNNSSGDFNVLPVIISLSVGVVVVLCVVLVCVCQKRRNNNRRPKNMQGRALQANYSKHWDV